MPAPSLIWEDLPSDTASYFSRAKVPGGWLVREVNDVQTMDQPTIDRGHFWTSAMTFIPDPQHTWGAEA